MKIPKRSILQPNYKEQGFTLPIPTSMGLIILLIGLTMVLRATDERSLAVARGTTADSFAVAEAGLASVLALLEKYPLLLSSSATGWLLASATTTTCSGTTLSTQQLQHP